LGDRSWLHHPQNVSAASYTHTLAQRNFRGHPESDFDFGAFQERRVGEKENPTRAQILGESNALNRRGSLAQGQRE
jgi:hypothetical protein